MWYADSGRFNKHNRANIWLSQLPCTVKSQTRQIIILIISKIYINCFFKKIFLLLFFHLTQSILTEERRIFLGYPEKPFEMQPFTVSELINDLLKIKAEHGDLQIAVRTIDEDTGLVQHLESVGLWVFLKKNGSYIDRSDETLEKKFLSMG